METNQSREFSAEESQIVEKHLKGCSTFLVNRKIQSKTTLRVHFTPNVVKINNSSDSSWCWGCGARGNILLFYVGV